MGRAAVVLLVLLAFGSGLASGFLVGTRTATSVDIPTREAVLADLCGKVGATPDQARKIHEIADENHPRMVKIRASVAADLAVIRSETRSRIRAVLETEDQRRKFEDWCQHRDAMRAAQEK